MTWQEYEDKVLEYFKAKFQNIIITKNVKIKGKLSETDRQIDVFIETQIADWYLPIVVECKKWQSKLDVANIGMFIDKLNDIGISRGIIISQKGYSEPAYKRAMQEKDLQLYILDFENMPQNLGFFGNPYRGHCGALISAPTGWVIDTNLTSEQIQEIGLCWFYPMGLTLQKAGETKQLMYFNIIPIQEDIDMLVEKQNQVVKNRDKNSKIEIWKERFPNCELLMRKIYYSNEDYTEYSAFIGTEVFYAFCIIVSKNEHSIDSLARLKYVINNTHFVVLEGVDPFNSDEAWKTLFNFR